MTEFAEAMYKLHYREKISPYLTRDVKTALAKRISAMTLKSPIWLDRETDYIEEFPELALYVKAHLSGLYLCTIMGAIVDEIREMMKGGKQR